MTLSRVAALVFLTAARLTHSIAQSPAQPPAAQRELSARIERLTLAPALNIVPEQLVAIDERGVVHLLDASTLQPAGAAPLTVGPGARVIGHTADTIFVMDRFRLYALARAGANAGRHVWTSGEVQQLQPGEADPEFLTRLIDACVVNEHVLVARSDGRLAGLSAAEGRTLWMRSLPNAAPITWHTDSDRAVIVLRVEGARKLLWVTDPATGSTPPTARLESVPLWAGMLGGTLVTVEHNQVCSWQPAAAQGRCLALATPVLARSLTVMPRDSDRPAVLVGLDLEQKLRGWSLRGDEVAEAWSVDPLPEVSGASIIPFGSRVVFWKGASAWMADLGAARLRSLHEVPGTLRSVHAGRAEIDLLYHPVAGKSEEASLVWRTVSETGDVRASRPLESTAASFSAAGHVIWSSDGLILADGSRVARWKR